jgi:hypothetical protein
VKKDVVFPTSVRKDRQYAAFLPLQLTEAEMSELVEFLHAPTSDDILRLAQETKPQTRTRN